MISLIIAKKKSGVVVVEEGKKGYDFIAFKKLLSHWCLGGWVNKKGLIAVLLCWAIKGDLVIIWL